MKSIISITKMSFLALAFLVISCAGGDDNGGGGTTTANGTIKAKVGGANFTSLAAATTAMKVATGNNFLIQLLGTSSTGKALSLTLAEVPATTGTYDIGGDNLISVAGSFVDTNISNPQASPTYVAPWDGGGVAGSITITEITDTKIVGTFHFTAKNQADQTDVKEVTNGAFNVNFQ
ncbi:MAG: DUF6252 family protein [Flavobacterium sp.]|nr:DUF6252 family protein [Flavobacterium sp.]